MTLQIIGQVFDTIEIIFNKCGRIKGLNGRLILHLEAKNYNFRFEFDGKMQTTRLASALGRFL